MKKYNIAKNYKRTKSIVLKETAFLDLKKK
jgi:hypothetical protein